MKLSFRTADDVASAIAPTAEVLAAHGTVMVPSETFYGLAADPRSQSAVDRVLALKDRPSDLGLPVLCADWRQLETLVVVPERWRVKLSRLWPAALTVILPCRGSVAASRGDTLAVRIPDHRELRALLYRVGPVTGTSANRHGTRPSTTTDAALRSLAGTPDLVLDAGSTPGGGATTLVDLTGSEARILRPGPRSWDEPYPDG